MENTERSYFLEFLLILLDSNCTITKGKATSRTEYNITTKKGRKFLMMENWDGENGWFIRSVSSHSGRGVYTDADATKINKFDLSLIK